MRARLTLDPDVQALVDVTKALRLAGELEDQGLASKLAQRK